VSTSGSVLVSGEACDPCLGARDGQPQLAPFADKAVAHAFSNADDDMFRREIAAMEKEDGSR
jgi:hypothetical protein